MRNPKFTTKEEYLKYRKQWKADYKELSQTIRDCRYINKAWGQAYGKATKVVSSIFPPPVEWFELHREITKLQREYFNENKQAMELFDKYKNKNRSKEHLRVEAHKMMQELKEAKLEAQRQYLAAKATLVPA